MSTEPNKQQVKVIEVTGVKLNPKAKYIITLEPQYGDWFTDIAEELNRLIGENFTLIDVPADAIKVLEIMPSEAAKDRREPK